MVFGLPLPTPDRMETNLGVGRIWMAASLRIQWGLLYRDFSRRETGALQPGTTIHVVPRLASCHQNTTIHGGKAAPRVADNKAVVIVLQ